MRHFSIPEIALLAKTTHFELVHSEAFLTEENPSENTWGVCFILKKLYKSKKNTKKLNPKNMIQDIAIKCVQNAGKENPQREENKLDVPMGRGRLFVLIVVVYNAELTGKPPCGEP